MGRKRKEYSTYVCLYRKKNRQLVCPKLLLRRVSVRLSAGQIKSLVWKIFNPSSRHCHTKLDRTDRL